MSHMLLVRVEYRIYMLVDDIIFGRLYLYYITIMLVCHTGHSGFVTGKSKTAD